MNYGEIKAKVAGYLDRDDLTSYVEDWILTILHNVERRKNLPYMFSLANSIGTTVAGTATYDLPERVKVIPKKCLWLENNNSKEYLTYIQPHLADQFTGEVSPSNNLPSRYTISAINGTTMVKTIKLFPTPDAAYPIKGSYYSFSADPTGNTSTNYLFAMFPELIIYGALMEAEPFLVNDARLQTWAAMLMKAEDELTLYANSELLNQEFYAS